MSRIAVVGGASALARRLIPVLRVGHEVVTLGRSGCDVPCDLLDSVDSIAIPEPVDAVVHLAAASYASTPQDMVRMVETNAVGTLKVCIAAEKAGARHLVLVSSVYAALTKGSLHHNLYSITKRQSEELAAEFCRRSALLLTVLRAAPLYGVEEAFRHHQPFLYDVADRAEEGRDIHLFGKRDALRNYLHANDMARVIQGVVERAPGGVYCCTFPRDFGLSEIAAAAQEAFGRGGNIVFLEDEPDVPDNIFGNCTDLYDIIGFRPGVDIREGMRHLARYRKEANP